jgi:hypothetical protein
MKKHGIDWKRQIDLPHPGYVSPQPLNATEAKLRLKQYLSQRDVRKTNLKVVIDDNGYQFSDDLDGIVECTKLFIAAAKSGEGGKELPDTYVEFLWNFGQFIGDHLISSHPKRVLKWTVENISIDRQHPHFVFAVKGYAGASEVFMPDRYLLQVAREIIGGLDVPSSIIRMQCERINQFAKAWYRTVH